MSKPNGTGFVCGDVPDHEVLWIVELKDKENNLLKKGVELACIVSSRTAFKAFQLASPRLGNPAFSDVVCAIAPEQSKKEFSKASVKSKKRNR